MPDRSQTAIEDSNANDTTEGAQERRLSQEAARWRVRFRDAERQIAMLRHHIADLEARAHSAPPAAELIATELGTLRRTVAELQEKQEAAELRAREAERKARHKTIQAALQALVIDVRLTDAAAARVVLEQYAAVDEHDAVVFMFRDDKGIERTVPATLDAAREHRLLSAIFFKNARRTRTTQTTRRTRARRTQENAS